MHSIFNHASRAQSLFNECMDGFRTRPPTPPARDYQTVLKDLWGRFRSWCGNLGALQLGHASLDYRLRESIDVQQSLISLIQDLQIDLGHCITVFTGEGQSVDDLVLNADISSDEDSDPEDDHADPQVELCRRLLNIESTIDSLYQLSFLIRNERSRQSAFRRAESYGKNIDGRGKDELEHFYVHDRGRAIDFVHQVRIESACEDQQTSPADYAALIDQLSQASSKRRRVFLYMEQHRIKLDIEHNPLPLEAPTNGGLLSEPQGVVGPSSTISGTQATSYYHSPIATVHQDSHSIAPSISTAKALDGRKVPLPKPPKLFLGQTEFQCPYCWVWCPQLETDYRRWRRHLFEDIRPYMCTYVRCSSPNELYGNRADWQSHESQAHRSQWKCRDHPDTTYHSPDDFSDHMKSKHARLTEREIQTACKYSVTTSPKDDRERCRICLISVTRLRPGQTLTNHVANHFEEFASPSFPDRGGEDDDKESEEDEASPEIGAEAVTTLDPDVDEFSDGTSDDFENEPETADNLSIHALASAGYKLGMRKLLDNDPDMEEKDEEGWTALQKAAYAGRRVILQMLLDAGADVNASSGYYGNALQCAAYQGHDQVLEVLLAGGAIVNQKGGYHGNALQAAACGGHESVVLSLLRAGADINAPNDRFMTATEGALANNHTNVVQILERETESRRKKRKGEDDIRQPATHEDKTGGQTTQAPVQTQHFQYNGEEIVQATDPKDGPQPPWQFSQSLGGYYVYQPGADFIILQNGRRFPRPSQITVASLSNAVWEYTGSPQGPTEAYQLQGQQGQLPRSPGGRPQALQQSAPPYPYPRSPLEEKQHAPRAMGTQGLAQTMAHTHLAPQSAQAPVQIRGLQHNGKQMMQAIDPTTQVQVLVETSPPEQITSPDLLAQGITARQSLLGTQSGDTEKLDSSFFIRPSKFFVVGRVFKTLWAEPAGGGQTAVTLNTVENRFGERVHSKVRWFVVIRQTHGAKYCSALPITTYGGTGVGRPGVVKSEHGIIYTGKDVPRLGQNELPRRNEDGIRSVPIRMDPDSPLDRLDPKARINFAAVHTVHHNVKVKSSGVVNAASISVLQQHFQNVWNPPRAGPVRSQRHQTQQRLASGTKTAAGGEASINVFEGDDNDGDESSDDVDDDDDDDGEEDEDEDEVVTDDDGEEASTAGNDNTRAGPSISPLQESSTKQAFQ